MLNHHTPPQMPATIEFFQGQGLPLLSREAYRLRQRLSDAFSTEPDSERLKRLVHLVVRANLRFERREAQYRTASQKEVAAT